MSFAFRFPVLPPWAQSALIVLLCLVSYGQILSFEFLNLDDNEYVVNNPWVANGLSAASINWALTTFDNPYYMPLTRLSFLLDASLFGVDARAFHLSNLVLHLLNSLLVFGLVRRLGFGDWIPLTVAAIFAVHPQHVEAVAWVAERKELLSALFGLLCLHCYVRYVSGPESSDLPQRSWLLLSLMFYLLSLLAKPIWVTLPLLLLLLDFWPLGILAPGRLMIVVRQKLPYMILAFLFGAVHAASGPGMDGFTVTDYGEPSLVLRIGHAMVAWALYLGQSFIPLGLSTYVPYPVPALPAWMLLASTVAMLLISALAIQQFRTRPHYLAGWAWFSIGLAPAIGIGVLELIGMKGVGESILICMRFTYMPHIGLFLATCVAIHAWSHHSRSRQEWTIGGLVVVIAILTSVTRSEVQYWRNSEAFWQHSINRSGEHQISLFHLGNYYLGTGKHAEAISKLHRANELDPTQPLGALFLGNAYREVGNLKAAYEHYHRMLDEALAPPDLLHIQALAFYLNGERELAESFRDAARQAGLSPEQERRNLAAFERSRRAPLPAGEEVPR